MLDLVHVVLRVKFTEWRLQCLTLQFMPFLCCLPYLETDTSGLLSRFNRWEVMLIGAKYTGELLLIGGPDFQLLCLLQQAL